ncbi:MAG TPA: hypothetical protein VMT30_09285 [Candidatus Saccharimonadia bacterium]|nr:hypothetical protein [Candidatus Saccharimonadia bacterium]
MSRPKGIWQGITPAQGWRAVFVTDDGLLRAEPMAFWAWVRRDYGDETEDVGEGVLARDSVHEVSAAEDEEYFVGYLHESEDIEVWRETSGHVLKAVKREQERVRQIREQKQTERAR